MSLPTAAGLELNSIEGPFQPKPFYDSLILYFSYKVNVNALAHGIQSAYLCTKYSVTKLT